MDLSRLLPRWATGGGALVSEPSEGQKDNGWAQAYRAPAHWFNWLSKFTYEWLADLRQTAFGWFMDWPYLFTPSAGHGGVYKGIATDGTITCMISNDGYYLVYTYDGQHFHEIDISTYFSPYAPADIAYGSGYWVIVHSNGAHLASDPLGSWSSIASLSGQNLRTVHNGGGYFVAGTSGGDVYYISGAPMGTWTLNTIATMSGSRRLFYDAEDDTWLMGGDIGHYAYCVGVPSGTWYDYDLGGSTYYAVGALTLNGQKVWYMAGSAGDVQITDHPSNGWSAATLPSFDTTPVFRASVIGPGILLIFNYPSSGGEGEGVLFTLDGTNFYKPALDLRAVNHAFYNYDRFIASGDGEIYGSLSHGPSI